jgi:predicted metal-dependent enzyme (double-stranded beta helix superfamily)
VPPAAFALFVDSLRELWSEGLPPEEHWPKVGELMRPLLADGDLQACSESWPVTSGTNLLFYEDPDHGFVVNAVVRDAHRTGSVHDHAHTWTAYGELVGGETISRYARLDDGSRPGHAELRRTGSIDAIPGVVDVVPPWLAHSESSRDKRAVAIIVRSQKLGSFQQNHFDPAANTVALSPGPRPEPYDLQP